MCVFVCVCVCGRYDILHAIAHSCNSSGNCVNTSCTITPSHRPRPSVLSGVRAHAGGPGESGATPLGLPASHHSGTPHSVHAAEEGNVPHSQRVPQGG